MTFKQVQEDLNKRIKCTDYLEASTGGLYCCPFCESGHGAHKTGALKYYPETNTVFCFSCNRKADALDLYEHFSGLDYKEALQQYAADNGITIDGNESNIDAGWAQHISKSQPEQQANTRKEAQPLDFSEYFKTAAEALQHSEPAQAYLKSRGISMETATAAGIGFDAEADPASAPGAAAGTYKAHPVPRIIIPVNKEHYVARSIIKLEQKTFEKLNNKGVSPGIFNQRVLWEADTVFVVQGAFDALSLMEYGADAIALNSTSNYKLLLEMLKERPTKATLLIALDNDNAGRKAQPDLQDGLNRLNIVNSAANIINGSYKDANDNLTGNKEAFLQALQQVQAQQGTRPDNTKDYIDLLMSGEIDRFKEAGNKRTGFANLDEKAGGLYSGLYVLAAISSLGKTTFALQLADQLAAAGHETIFFSMEQSRLEMVSKSISRFTAQANKKTAVSSLSIRRGYLPESVLNAADKYKAAVGNRLSIVQGNFNCTIGYIGQYIRNYKNRTGTRPTIIIDYLQILQPAQDGASKGSKKDDIDLAVTELKRISRELDLTIIVISSVNRANYQTEFSFESLKESGGIEYTADVVWGLQLQCLDEPVFSEDKKQQEKRRRIAEAKAETPRRIKFTCIKNRYGISNYSCYFNYTPEYDLFEVGQEPDTKKPGKRL